MPVRRSRIHDLWAASYNAQYVHVAEKVTALEEYAASIRLTQGFFDFVDKFSDPFIGFEGLRRELI